MSMIQNLIGNPVTISPGILNSDTGSLYYLLENSGWNAADAAARQLGGNLVTVNSQEEQDWLVSTFSYYGNVDRFLWIGLTDAAIEGTWVWTSGEPVTYTNWEDGEPNANVGGENFAQMFGSMNWQGIPVGQWNDVYDSPWPYSDVAPGFGPVYGVVEITSVPELGNTATLMILAVGILIGFEQMTRKAIAR